MTELFITYAKVMSEETILNDLQKALEEYKNTKSDEAKQKLTMYSSMVMIKFASEDKSVSDVLSDVAQKRNILDTFSPDEK